MKLLLSFLFIILFSASSYCAESIVLVGIPPEAEPYLKKYTHTINPYGNLAIEAKLEDSFADDMREIKRVITEKWERRGIFINVPLSLGNLGQTILDLGFELYDINKKESKLIYVYRNGRAIPDISNAFLSASVFIIRINPDTQKEEVLIVNEYDKNVITIPGGCTDNMETMRASAVREAGEEAGVKLNPDNLEVVAVFNDVKQGIERNQVFTNFMTRVPFDTNVKIDGKEVMGCEWIPVDELLDETFELWGKKLMPTYRGLLEMIKTGHTDVPMPGLLVVAPLRGIAAS